MKKKVLRILGIRGVPAAHGGFETFAECIAPYLVQNGWRVVVYCQQEGAGPIYEDTWRGVERVHIPVAGDGARSTIIFDWKSIRHAASHKDLCLTLGYNTAVFCALLRMKGISNVINMDGIEWSRAKWGALAKLWFWLNDWAGCWLGDHLVADHPEINRHLQSRAAPQKISTIAYGAEAVESASEEVLAGFGVAPNAYLSVIARPEPENSILEIVEGFSRKTRGVHLLVLGKYSDGNPYHRAVLAAASDEVKFVGAIYDKEVLRALRFHSLAYVHGHQVGGTNPSLVEAMGAGNAIIAHDNRFTRWVVGPGARYFDGADSFEVVLESLLSNRSSLAEMKAASRARYQDEFTWPKILGQYEGLLSRFVPGAVAGSSQTAA